MSFNRSSLLGIAAATFVAAVLVSCSDANDDPPDLPELPTATPRAASPTTPSSPSSSPTPSPTPDAEVEQENVIAAASEALGGARHISPLTLDACLEGNPDRNPCYELRSAPEEIVRGLARFTVGDPDGGAAAFLMGRLEDGAWAYWHGSQQQSYVLDTLPGALLTCDTDSPPTVRESPSTSAPALATLDDLAELQAEEFLLVEPGQYGVDGERGQGWYRVTEPAGWIEATHTTDAALGDCLLHDAVEQLNRG